MNMVALSPDAKGHLNAYLKQVKTALAGQSSVDAAEVERDVLSHIDAELSEEPEPVPAHRLLAVLDRLGEPHEWVPPEQSPWRKPLAALQSQPGDWRLAFVAFGSLALAFVLMLGRVMLWPLPPLLVAVSFITARVMVGLLHDRGEALGWRQWLVYPSMLLVYVPLLVALAGGPALPLANVLDEDPAARTRLATFVGLSPWVAVPAVITLVIGCWWALLGLLSIQFVAIVRALFRPFANGFERRHATRLALAGVVLAVLGVAALTLPRLLVATVSAQETTLASARPVDPVIGITEAFQTHPLVAIADPHGNEQVHAFRLSLIRDSRLAGVFNDIVVEFGTTRYQDVMDRFIRGEDVPYASLRRVWEDTTQVESDWDLPIYEEFFRVVRDVNASRQAEQRMRVLLGDPAMDWENIHAPEEYLRRMMSLNRDQHAVEIIQREVLAKNRRALIIYGGQHLVRKNAMPNATDEWARGIVGQLERPGIASVFTIDPETRIPLVAGEPDISSWPRPRLAVLKGTTLGQLRVTLPQQRLVRFDEQFDAVVYLGQPSEMTLARIAPARCADDVYMAMRLSRLALLRPPAGAPAAPADLLRAHCASR